MIRLPNRWRSSVVTLVIVAFLSSAVSSPVQAAPPASFFKPGMPDFDQQNNTLGMMGKFHCSPTAAANSLSWFDNNGYDVVPDMWNDGAPPPGANKHVGLIGDLGNKMSTNGGTWNDNMVKGYRNYLQSASNNSGTFFDVKFQGTKYFRGYTVGQNSATVNLDWIKQELADGEDVTLTIDWYTETSPGVWSGPMGAHSVTLDGYTSGGASSDLLIADPWYAEGIIERDPESIGANRLIYEYSTGTANMRAEIVGAIAVSPKPFLFFDGLPTIPEYFNYPVTCTNCLASNNFGDYVSLGLDLGNELNNITSTVDLGHISILDPSTNNGYVLDFDETGLLDIYEVLGGIPSLIPDPDNNFELAYNFGTNVSTELFINRDVFGDLLTDTNFEIAYQVDPGMVPGSPVVVGSHLITAQTTTITPEAGAGPPDYDGDEVEDYFLYVPEGTLLSGQELIDRNAAIASIPEPSTLALFGLVLFGIAASRRR